MSKKSIWILTIISSIALIGLITIQIYWVKEAADVKKKQFEQLVTKVMSQVVNKLEIMEATDVGLSLLNDQFIEDKPAISSEPTDTSFQNISGSGYSLGEEFYLEPPGNDISISTKIDHLGDTVIFVTSDSLPINITDPDNVRDIISREELNQKFKGINKIVFVQNIVEKMVNFNIRIEDRLSISGIDSLLKIECEDKGITLDYEFAVRDSEFKYVIQSESFNRNTNQNKFQTLLFPNDVLASPSLLMIYFPSASEYIHRSIGFITIYTIFLTVFIIVVFSITIYFIFRQKMVSEIKADFINNMTHELKTPISTISLASQMLKDISIVKDASMMKNISGIIDEESKRLGYQVEKVLQMSLFDKGKIEYKLTTVNINVVIQDVVNKLLIQLNKEKGSIITNLKAKSSNINVDKLHFTNVIFNLLDNAIKYCKEYPEITIETKDGKRGIIIDVIDQGIGMANDVQGKIFEKFYRVPTGNLHDVKGFGLGLSYVKKIIEEHSGSITVYSEINKGTHFQIILPYN